MDEIIEALKHLGFDDAEATDIASKLQQGGYKSLTKLKCLERDELAGLGITKPFDVKGVMELVAQIGNTASTTTEAVDPKKTFAFLSHVKVETGMAVPSSHQMGLIRDVKLIDTIDAKDIVNSVCFLPTVDPSATPILAAGLKKGSIVVFEGPRELKRWKAHSGDAYVRVSFDPTGQYLASGSWDMLVKLWDWKQGKEIKSWNGHSGSVSSVCFHPSGEFMASGSHDETIQIYEMKTFSNIASLESGTYVYSTSFDPSGQFIASGLGDRTIKIWDWRNMTETTTLSGHSSVVTYICFDPSGVFLASGSWDKSIKLWDWKQGKEMKTFTGHSHYVYSLCFDPSGKFLASASDDKSIKLWNIQEGKEVKTLQDHSNSVLSVHFHPTERYLASGSADKTMKLWEIVY